MGMASIENEDLNAISTIHEDGPSSLSSLQSDQPENLLQCSVIRDPVVIRGAGNVTVSVYNFIG